MTVAAEGFVEAQIAEPRHGFRSRWYRTPAFVAGVIIVGTILTLAILAPLIAPYDPNKQDLPEHPRGPVDASTGSAPISSGATSGRGCCTPLGSTSRSASWPCSSPS